MTPTLLTDDAPDHILESAAEQQRQAAFQSLREWHGLPLAWTSSRAGLYEFLRIPPPALSAETLKAIRAARDAEGTPEADALQDRANELYLAETGGSSNGHVRNATIILWLAAHQPKDWRSVAHDRAKLLELIDDWTDEHVAPHEIERLAEVTNQLITDADATRAVPRIKHSNLDEVGN